MARKLRIDEAGLTYHVWLHAIDALPIYKAPDVKDQMVSFLREEAVLSEWIVFDWVVMTTHHHVLLKLTKPTLSSGFQRLHCRFAQYYNKLHRRRGHVFESRFGARIIGSKFDHMEMARYVARNPVTARICDAPEDWQWSSFASVAGLAPVDGIVNLRAARAPFGGSPEAYRDYVLEHDWRVRWGQAGGRPRALREAPRPPLGRGGSRR